MMNKQPTASQTIVLLLIALALSGCTTTRPVDSTTGLAEQIEPGDHLIVYENSGRKLDMTLQALGKDRLTGTLRKDDSVTVDVLFTDIEKMEVETIDGKKTTMAVGGVLLGAVILIGLPNLPYPGFPQ